MAYLMHPLTGKPMARVVSHVVDIRLLVTRRRVLEGVLYPEVLPVGTLVVLNENLVNLEQPFGTVEGEQLIGTTGHRGYLVRFPTAGIVLVDETRLQKAEDTMGHRLIM